MYKILQYDPYLVPFQEDIKLRMERYEKKIKELLPGEMTLTDFANGSSYFGFHKVRNGWYYREWAPGAEEMYLTGDFCGWDRRAYPMKKKRGGVFELFLRGTKTLQDGMKVMAIIVREGQELERIPLYIRRVVQDPQTAAWNGVIYDPPEAFRWTDSGFVPACFRRRCGL